MKQRPPPQTLSLLYSPESAVKHPCQTSVQGCVDSQMRFAFNYSLGEHNALIGSELGQSHVISSIYDIETNIIYGVHHDDEPVEVVSPDGFSQQSFLRFKEGEFTRRRYSRTLEKFSVNPCCHVLYPLSSILASQEGFVLLKQCSMCFGWHLDFPSSLASDTAVVRGCRTVDHSHFCKGSAPLDRVRPGIERFTAENDSVR